MARGIVFDVQRGALTDGPGIRTTVFLKGCPLRCRWCHNPESMDPEIQTAVAATGKKTFGREMSADEVLAVVRRDIPFYGKGGGMTLSGGEPTLQPRLCLELLHGAKALGIHTCLDTCGLFPRSMIPELLGVVDLFLFDYKATGDSDHRRLTGVPQEPILENLRELASRGARIRLRCPMVKGIHDTPEHVAAIRNLRDAWPSIEGVDIMPYHRSGDGKWRDLGKEPPDFPGGEPDPETVERWREALA